MSPITPLPLKVAHKAKLPSGWLLVEPDYKGKYTYTVEPDPTPRTLDWYVVQNRVVLIPDEAIDTLTQEQKIRLFTPILFLKRKESEHSQGIFSACIHISTDRSITIAENVDRQASEFNKECAEMMALSRMKDMRNNKIEQTYIMVGFDNRPNQKAFCPCGRCTDSLAKNMTNAASIAIIPVCEPGTELPISTVKSYTDLKPQEIWSTNIGVLNRHYKLPLNAHETYIAQEAKRVITSHQPWRDKISAPERHLQTTMSRVLQSSSFKRSPGGAHKFMAASFNPNSADNKKHALEADPSSATINNFCINEIAHAYKSLEEAVKNGRLDAIPQDLKIRCGIIRMSDGSFETAVEVRGKSLSAVTAVEITLTTAAQRSHTNITDCWITEMDLRDIDEGKMHTSPKEGVERLFKRIDNGSDAKDVNGKPIKGSMNLHYTVLNLGGLKNEEVEKITRKYKIQEIFPSAFPGVKNGHGQAENQSHLI